MPRPLVGTKPRDIRCSNEYHIILQNIMISEVYKDITPVSMHTFTRLPKLILKRNVRLQPFIYTPVTCHAHRRRVKISKVGAFCCH